ncbi:MAG: hypothetical protein JGK08_18125 [Microcoleus sp. PH2017_04_SCI_O_A]|nr:hypothetical protein [Microcoleus sp. PH2017_04_SCI_O_A]MCC3510314.1 hypothetical protein [Microcoleus sp. PH2017_17_BER_D_A]
MMTIKPPYDYPGDARGSGKRIKARFFNGFRRLLTPITNYQLPITNCQLPTANCQLTIFSSNQ